jgi:hypothetical protein
MNLSATAVTFLYAVTAFSKILVIYFAAFSYMLDWRVMMALVFVAGLIFSYLDDAFFNTMTETEKKILFSENSDIISAISVIAMIAILTILTYYSSFGAALGIYFVPNLTIMLFRLLLGRM